MADSKRDDEKGVGAIGVIGGVVAVALVGVAGWFGYRYFTTTPIEIDEPVTPPQPAAGGGEKPPPVPGPAPKPKATTSTTTVPAMTKTPYNDQKLSSPQIVAGILAGLSTRYQTGAQEANGRFQADWNKLAKAGKLSPGKLNNSRLKVDGVMGVQTLRAVEWADDGNHSAEWAAMV